MSYGEFRSGCSRSDLEMNWDVNVFISNILLSWFINTPERTLIVVTSHLYHSQLFVSPLVFTCLLSCLSQWWRSVLLFHLCVSHTFHVKSFPLPSQLVGSVICSSTYLLLLFPLSLGGAALVLHGTKQAAVIFAIANLSCCTLVVLS